MKIRLLLALVGLAISFAWPISAQQKVTVDPQIAQQIRVLASKYDEAINKHDAAAVAALYTQDGVRGTYNHGSFRGRKAIEKAYESWDFNTWHVGSHFTSVERVTAVGNDVRSTGRWSCVFKNWEGADDDDGGYYSWVVVRDGDSWKIRRSNASGAGNRASTN